MSSDEPLADKERETALVAAFNKHREVKAAGFAGISRKTGFICDRREERDAIPMQKNTLLGIPEPTPLPEQP